MISSKQRDIDGSSSESESDSSSDEEEAGAGGAGVRPVKGWKREGVGAPEAGDGRYVHRWQEHKVEDSTGQFKYGKWTTAEDTLLLEAYDAYCLEHELEGDDRLKPVLDGVVGTTVHDCWLEVASRFKHRTVRAVLRRAIRLIHPGNFRGEWSQEERQTLLALVAKHGKAWKEIGRLMNRLPASVNNQYCRLTGVGGDGEEAAAAAVGGGAWSAEEEARLVELVRALGRPTPTGGYVDVPWVVVGTRHGTRTASQCNQKWLGGFGERALKLGWDAAADAALVDAVHADGGESREEVYWATLMPGRTAADCRRRFDALCKRLPPHLQRSFPAAVDALHNEMRAAAAAAAAAATSFVAAHAARRGGGGKA